MSQFKKSLKQPLLFKFFNFWPPAMGAGFKVDRLHDDGLGLDVVLKYKWWNRNFVGTQFGGSLYSMCDPFFMLILMENLGNEYIVWDKAAKIQFLKPGKTKVRATFRVERALVEKLIFVRKK